MNRNYQPTPRLGIDEVLAQENVGGEVLWTLADHQEIGEQLRDYAREF